MYQNEDLAHLSKVRQGMYEQELVTLRKAKPSSKSAIKHHCKPEHRAHV